MNAIMSGRKLKFGAVVLGGLVLLAFVVVKAQARGPWGDDQSPRERIELMSKVLDLTPDQESKVKAIVEDSRQKREELRAKHLATRTQQREEMYKLRDDARDSIDRVLDEKQRTKLKMLVEYRGGSECRDGDRDGPGSRGWRGCDGPEGDRGRRGDDRDCDQWGRGGCR